MPTSQQMPMRTVWLLNLMSILLSAETITKSLPSTTTPKRIIRGLSIRMSVPRKSSLPTVGNRRVVYTFSMADNFYFCLNDF